MKYGIWGVVALALLGLTERPAHALWWGDPLNTTAPGAFRLGRQIVVRKNDTYGSLWTAGAENPSSWSVVTPGCPVKTISGAVVGTYANQGGWHFIQPNIVVLGADGNIWLSAPTWHAVGHPPAGVATAPAVADDYVAGNSFTIAVVDNNQIPWTLKITPSNVNLPGPWTQVPGSQTLASAPGIALDSGGRFHIFGTATNAQPIHGFCAFGNCFNTWNVVPNTPVISGITGLSNNLSPAGLAGYIVARGSDGLPWLATSTNDLLGFDVNANGQSWVSLGGLAIDGQPTVLQGFNPNTSTIVVVHRTGDGNYWSRDTSPGGFAWRNLGHP